MVARWLIIATAAVALLSACENTDHSPHTAAASATVNMRLIETSDVHMHLMNFNYLNDQADESIGLVKAASLIKQAQQQQPNNILVDNGDLLQGSAMGDYVFEHDRQLQHTHPAYVALNSLHYDVGNLGNHEFNYGLPFLKRAIAQADFPYVNANIFNVNAKGEATDNAFTPYVLLKRQVVDQKGQPHTLTIGVLGLVTPQIMQWDRDHLQGKVMTRDMVAMAHHYVPKMKAAGADIIVAVPHSGLELNPPKHRAENAVYDLAQVKGIDAIMFGHAHQLFPGGTLFADHQQQGINNKDGKILGVPAVMPGYWANHIGVIDLTLRQQNGQWQVANSHAELRNVKPASADAQLSKQLANPHQQTRTWVNKPVATLANAINSFFALVHDDASLRLINDAQRWYGKQLIQGTELAGIPVLAAASPFRTGFQGAQDFTDIRPGALSYRGIAGLYVFPNTAQVIKLNGKQLREWLEMSAGQFNQLSTTNSEQSLLNSQYPSFNFDVIDGVDYQIDVSQPARYNANGQLIAPDSHRIVGLEYQQRPVAEDQVFLLVTNNYRASGGGHFPGLTPDMVVIRAPDLTRNILQRYIEQQQQQHGALQVKPDNNWQLTGLPKGTQVPFVSSASEQAQQQAKQHDDITYDHDLADKLGYGRYSLMF